MSIIVRPAEYKDALGIAKVHVLTWQNVYRGLIPDDFLDNMSVEERQKMWEKNLATPLPGVRIFIAEDSNGIIGFSDCGPNRDEVDNKKHGELYAIYVFPEHWRRGIGKLLINQITKQLKDEGYEYATLWVLEGNSRARKFYEVNGWKFDGRVKPHPKFGINEARYTIRV